MKVYWLSLVTLTETTPIDLIVTAKSKKQARNFASMIHGDIWLDKNKSNISRLDNFKIPGVLLIFDGN